MYYLNQPLIKIKIKTLNDYLICTKLNCLLKAALYHMQMTYPIREGKRQRAFNRVHMACMSMTMEFVEIVSHNHKDSLGHLFEQVEHLTLPSFQ